MLAGAGAGAALGVPACGSSPHAFDFFWRRGTPSGGFSVTNTATTSAPRRRRGTRAWTADRSVSARSLAGGAARPRGERRRGLARGGRLRHQPRPVQPRRRRAHRDLPRGDGHPCQGQHANRGRRRGRAVQQPRRGTGERPHQGLAQRIPIGAAQPANIDGRVDETPVLVRSSSRLSPGGSRRQ